MSKTLQWIGYGLIFLVILLLALWGFARWYVGAINFPTGGDDIDVEDVGGRLQVPDGFGVSLYAEVQGARTLKFTDAGDLLVINSAADKVILLERDADGDSLPDGQRELMSGLNRPHGLEIHDGYLYVGETDAIGRVPFDVATGTLTGNYEQIVTGLPGGENHWRKTIKFGPDGRLYVAMGSSCNVCIEKDKRRATLVTYAADGSDEQIYATGLRNSAGFDWSPVDGAIYATDNGRDMLGDDFPPCELNRVVEGADYGWPFANGQKIPDPDFGKGNEDKVDQSLAPVFEFRAHNAPLGIKFISHPSLPAEYQNTAVVALHGSWNRSEKDGYKVVSLHWNENGDIESRDFLWGFLDGEDVYGRPAEIEQGPDGAVYIADDFAGLVYRVAPGDADSINQPLLNARTFDVSESLAGYSPEDKQQKIEEGAQLYRQYQCVSCHADSGPGLKKLEALGVRYDVETLKGLLERPTAPMPLFPFDDEQRESLAVYLLDRYPD